MTEDPNKFYETLATHFELTVEEVRQILYFFWRQGVNKCLNEFTSHELYIAKLGSFKVKDYKIKYEIPRVEENIKNGVYHQESIPYMTDYMSHLARMDKIFKELKEERKKFNELNKQTSRNISEQNQNLGGVKEQDI
jgi:ketol-acid reductoisomerase